MKSLLSSTLNTRELGGYRFSGGITKTGRILRSDRICEPSSQDIEYLKGLDITTVIDLRTDEDVSESPCGLTEEMGFSYHHIPIVEGGYVPKAVEDVVPSYLAIASEKNMADVFRTIAAAPEGVIFNCWAGKDRTGVTAAIILMLCGVSDDDITENYMLTKPYSEKLWEMIRQFRPEEEMKIIIPDEKYIRGFLNAFRGRYDSAEGYLDSIGLTETEIEKIKQKLCGQS